METTADFGNLVGDAFFASIFNRTNIIYNNSERAEVIAAESNYGLAIPSLMRLTKTFVGRIMESLKLEKDKRDLGSIAHDFKNVLTAVSGSADMVESFWLNEKYSQSITEISSLKTAAVSSRNMAVDVAGNFLDMDLSKFKTEVVVEDSGRKLDEIIKTAFKLSESRQIGKYNINCLTPITIYRIGYDIERVLLNLFLNAYDAMREKHEEGGYDGKPQPFIHVFTDVSRDGGLIDIDVKDNGPGIKSVYLNSIFQNGFTTKKESGGQGIGLANCKQITQKIGGRISVESEFGEWTKFRIRISLKK